MFNQEEQDEVSALPQYLIYLSLNATISVTASKTLYLIS